MESGTRDFAAGAEDPNIYIILKIISVHLLFYLNFDSENFVRTDMLVNIPAYFISSLENKKISNIITQISKHFFVIPRMVLERGIKHPNIITFFQMMNYYYYLGLKSCSSLLDNASLRVSTCHVRNFSTFSVRPSKKHCPSSRCALAANVVGKDFDIFAGGAVSLNHILQACTKPFTVSLFH
jgi:hypothetical protein